MKCDTPFYVLPKAGTEKVPVPCGRCPPCKQRRVNQWVFRLMQEHKNYLDAHFVTLTYDTFHVPISPNGFMTLRKKDFQDYMKRLRKLVPDATLKYYCAGEYGSTNFRPHYHAIIFGVPDKSLFYDAWHIDGSPIGAIHVGTVTNDSIAYTMKYIDKTNGAIHRHSRDDRQPEFSLMSKGLGVSYVNDSTKRYHSADVSRNYVTHVGGMRVALPRYYRHKIFPESDLRKIKAECTDLESRGSALIDYHNFSRKQMELIESIEKSNMDKLRKEFETVDHGGKLTFESWLDLAKHERYRKFYHSQKVKSRNL